MNDNIDLKLLWRQRQSSNMPLAGNILTGANKLKQKTIRTIILTNILLLATCGFLITIGYFYHPTILTVLGLALIILAILMNILSFSSFFVFLYSADMTGSSHIYLQQMLKFKQKQEFLHTTMLEGYFILLSVGLCLYMTGPTSQMPLVYTIVTYGLTFAWIGFNWFYLRPRTIGKKRAEIDEIIARLKALTQQLDMEN